MVSNLFYPFDETGEAKSQFKNLIENSFKTYCHVIKDEITEDKFCEAMVLYLLYNFIITILLIIYHKST